MYCIEYKAFRVFVVMYIIMNSKNIIDVMKEMVYLIAVYKRYDILFNIQALRQSITAKHTQQNI